MQPNQPRPRPGASKMAAPSKWWAVVSPGQASPCQLVSVDQVLENIEQKIQIPAAWACRVMTQNQASSTVLSSLPFFSQNQAGSSVGKDPMSFQLRRTVLSPPHQPATFFFSSKMVCERPLWAGHQDQFGTESGQEGTLRGNWPCFQPWFSEQLWSGRCSQPGCGLNTYA